VTVPERVDTTATAQAAQRESSARGQLARVSAAVVTGAAGTQAAPSTVASTPPQATRANPLVQLNTAVTRWFDDTASALGQLPATPVSEFIQGALLLVRRTLFNQTPSARPVNYLVGAFGDTVGTIGAVDLEGDALTYSLTRQPLFGTVEIGADGTYAYTAGADFAGYDSFAVGVSDRGFNLLNPFSSRSTEAFVEVPYWSRGAGETSPSTAVEIYNFTGQNVLVRSVTRDPSVSNPVEPKPPLIVHPGDIVRVEIASALFSTLDPTRISFGVPQGPSWEVSIDPNLLGLTARVSCTQGYCTYPAGASNLTPKILLVDAPGTVWDFSQDSVQGQQILNSLLKVSETLEGTVNLSYENALVGPKTALPSDYVFTYQSATNFSGSENFEFEKDYSVTVTRTATTSWQFEASIGGKILKLVDVAVSGTYAQGTEVSESRTFGERKKLRALPYSYNAVYAAAPTLNVTGDLKATFGPCTLTACTSADPNVTFWLRDVDYTYPDPKAPANALLYLTRAEPYQPDQTAASLNKGFQIRDAQSWPVGATVPLDPTYQMGEQHQLITKAYLGPTVALAEDFTRNATYTSSNEAVATVSASGLLTALGPGTTRITATYAWEIPNDQKGQVGAYMDVTVVAAAT